MKISEMSTPDGESQNAEVRQLTVTPLVYKLRAVLQVKSRKYAVSKAGNDMIEVVCEIISPDYTKAPDPTSKELKQYTIAGQEVKMYLLWGTKVQLENLREFMELMELDPAEHDALDKDNPETLLWLDDIAFNAYISSKAGEALEWDPEKGEAVAQKDEAGNPVPSGARWNLLNNKSIISRTARLTPF